MIKRLFLVSLISVLFITAFVIAAGSSSGNAPNNNNVVANSSANCQTAGGTWKYVSCSSTCSYQRAVMNGEQVVCGAIATQGCDCGANKCWNGQACEQLSITTCEDKGTLRDRIRCRFENPSVARSEAYNSIEEACRDHNKTQACEALYNRAAVCYTQLNHSAKKECFLRESGININSQGTFRASPDENKRNYVVLLLYELQERIEEYQEEGKITTDQATSLIAKIIEIKKMILAQESRSSIIVKINEFKQEYKDIIGGIQ